MKYSVSIKWIEETDSTNSEVLRHIDDFDNLSVLSAIKQTAGRGQRGNKWVAAPGENLTFSLLLRPGKDGVLPVAARDQFLISIISTLAVHDTLDSYGIESSVKWPNDIYVGNRKICGMLVENALGGDRVSSSVIGIGLNVNQATFDPSLLNPASMFTVSGKRFSPDEVLGRFCRFFSKRLEEAEAGKESLSGQYCKNLYRKDIPCEYTNCADGAVFTGIIRGIDEIGRLLIEKPAEGLVTYSFKEVSYII